MIVEIFGPAGAGKTTLTSALAQELTARGVLCQAAASARPAETAAGRSVKSAWVSRAAKLTSMLAPTPRGSGRSVATGELLRRFPIGNPVWWLRYRHYLHHLEVKWQEATRRAGVTVFDQAYLCAVCSMSVLAGRTEYEDIHEACAVAPLADIIVQIEADERLLGPRLAARIGQQSAVERLFELSPAISMKQVDVARVITVVMTERDQALLRINGNALSTPQQNAIQIADEIAARVLGSKTCAA